jgi:hypothetical protein
MVRSGHGSCQRSPRYDAFCVTLIDGRVLAQAHFVYRSAWHEGEYSSCSQWHVAVVTTAAIGSRRAVLLGFLPMYALDEVHGPQNVESCKRHEAFPEVVPANHGGSETAREARVACRRQMKFSIAAV